MKNKKTKAIKKTKALVVVKSNYNLAKINEMSQMADVLKAHILRNQLFTKIRDRDYVHVEGWQYAGGLIGLYPRVVGVESLSNGSEIKWSAKVEIFNPKTDKVMAVGFAICSNKEEKKKSFDEYAVLSMAQTRAIGKAFRNLLGWVMKLSGFEATPAEEIKGVKEAEKKQVATAPSSKPEVNWEAKLIDLAVKYGAKEGHEIEFIEKKFGKKIAWNKLNDKSFRALHLLLMGRMVKNGKCN